MSIDVRRALRSAYAALKSTDGANVFSVLLVFNVAYGAVSQSFRRQLLDASGRPGGQTGLTFPPPLDIELLALDLPLALLAVLTLAAVVASEAVRFWAIRLFADRPAPALRERFAVLVAVGGGFALVIYGLRQLLPVLWSPSTLQLTAGLAVAPLLLVTVYLRQEIALTERGLSETVRNSLVRFRDDPVPILGLLLVLAALGQLAALPAAVLSRVVAVRAGGTIALLVDVLNRVLGAGVSTFSIAAITDAYLQSRDDGTEASAG